MRNLTAAALAGALFAAAGCDSTVHGNGVFREEGRSVEPFSAVSIGLGIQARIHADATAQSLTVSGDSNVLQYVKTRVTGGVLETKLEGVDTFDSVHRLQLAIQVPALVSARAYGGADVEIQGLAIESFAANASEGSAIVIAGADATERTFLSATASGTSAVDAGDFPVADAAVALSGGSTVIVDVSGGVTCSVAAGSTLTNKGTGGCL